jgi:replication initiation protein RepC
MGSYAPKRSGGMRRYNQFNAVVDRLAKGYVGQEKVSPARLLGKLKCAAPYIGISPAVLALMDALIPHSKPQDWLPGRVPLVWPRNETLSRKLGVSVRQVQKTIRAAIEFGLMVPHDSPNGHRGGKRNAAGDILWGYGFDLRPLGTRAEEFDAIAAKGYAEDREFERLKRALSAARRRARTLANAVLDANIGDVDAAGEVELVRMALDHVKGSRNLDAMIRCLAQVTSRVDAFQAKVDAALEALHPGSDLESAADRPVESSPKGERQFVHSTTTTQLKTAHAVTGRSFARKSSGGWDIALLAPQSNVEADLERHGVDAKFVAKAAPELIWDLDPGPRAWGRLVSIAEGLTGQYAIGPHAWREACRLMGQRGAAAAVIATVAKAVSGEVRSPGAYLRGMTAKAAAGELNLGKTFHGMREARAVDC